MQLIDMKEIDVSLKALVKGIRLTTERVQTLAIQAAAYSFIMRDPTVANKLYEAVSTNKSLRKDSLVKYLEVNSHLAFDSKAKRFAFHLNPKIGDTFGALPAECEAALIANRWDDAKAEPTIVSEYDMEAQVRAFIGKMTKIASDKAIKIKNPDALAVVEQTFARWSAEATLKSMQAMDETQQAGEIAAVVPGIMKASDMEGVKAAA